MPPMVPSTPRSNVSVPYSSSMKRLASTAVGEQAEADRREGDDHAS